MAERSTLPAGPLVRRVALLVVLAGVLALLGLALLSRVVDGADRRPGGGPVDSVVPPDALRRAAHPLPTGEDWWLVVQRTLDLVTQASREDPEVLRAVVAPDCPCREDPGAPFLSGPQPDLLAVEVVVAPDGRAPADEDLPAREVTLRARVRERTPADTGVGRVLRPPNPPEGAGDGQGAVVTDGVAIELRLRRSDDRAPWLVHDLRLLQPGLPLLEAG